MLDLDPPTAVPAIDSVGDDQELADAAVALARRLLLDSEQRATRLDRRQRRRLGRIIADRSARELTFALTDQVLRSGDDRQAGRLMASIIRSHDRGAFPFVDRVLLGVGGALVGRLPRLVMPLVRRRLIAEARTVVIAADDPEFADHVAKRAAHGVRLNINPLGEAILSDAEAEQRLRVVLDRITRPDVDYVSVKISALVANLDVLAFEHSVDRISDRLRTVYRAAAHTQPTTFVNLDMEEYRDLELSVAAFTRVLDEPEFVASDAGIVLQAYLPDSHRVLDRLGDWAMRRHARAGGTIKVRLVKGANLAMERVDAELHGWVAAPYGSKADVDASFKALLDSALRPQWRAAVRVGLASHNLFDVAWGLVLRQRLDAVQQLEIEMLEGMAPAQARAVQAASGAMLLYAPVVSAGDFPAAISYLSRRLDENTQPDNFLRSLFTLQVDSSDWHDQERRFRVAVAERHAVSTERRRWPRPDAADDEFHNRPDTDFTDPAQRRRVLAELADVTVLAPPAIDDEHTIDSAVAAAQAAFATWAGLDSSTRRAALRSACAQMRTERLRTVAVIAAETGKPIAEADPEVSEAIDFGEYYAGPGIDLLDQLTMDGLVVTGRGVVVVCGPWNFPYAIPAGAVFAALAAGNAVLVKPAPEAVGVAATFVAQLHASGIDPSLVQLVVCADGPVGKRLVTHPDVDTVVLTGSLATVEMFLGWKPELRLFAETSGKNALVITAAADLDLALADLVRSAFGHAGQKCSAASLAIVEASVYDDPQFMRRLREVVTSWRVGWPTDPATMIGPLIAPPSGALHRGLTQLEDGERWLVEPRPLDDSGRLWSPGVRVGVQRGSWFHRTECFGPVLGVMRAADLDDALSIQNDSAFGLTGGIHSLDTGEVAQWCAQVEVGNAYVNRAITGAVVQRQPFGGWKRSSVGPGAKAGGPSYILQFAKLGDPSPAAPINDVRDSYRHWWQSWFQIEHDPSGLVAESNVLRHRPVSRVVVSTDGTPDSASGLARLHEAARVTGVELVEADPGQFDVGQFDLRPDDRVRLLGEHSPGLIRRLHEAGLWVLVGMPSSHGRVELMHWVREQSLSHTQHRHGRLAE